MRLYNTISKKIEEFIPLDAPNVSFYTCGPTVYDYVHIGNLRTYTNNDILRRVLIYNNYKVKHVMNITDVGHLTGDVDTGEDKLEKGAQKQKKSVWEAARYFTDYFFNAVDQLNILRPDIVCRATEHIPAMIDLITRLHAKHLTYETDQAVYFDTEAFQKYAGDQVKTPKQKKLACHSDLADTETAKKIQMEKAV